MFIFPLDLSEYFPIHAMIPFLLVRATGVSNSRAVSPQVRDASHSGNPWQTV